MADIGAAVVQSTSIRDVLADRATWRRVGVRSLVLGLGAAALGALTGGTADALIWLVSTLLVVVPLTFAQTWLADHTLFTSLSFKLTAIAISLVTLALVQGLYTYFVLREGATPPEAWGELVELARAMPFEVLWAFLVNVCSLGSGLGIAAAINLGRRQRAEVLRAFALQYGVIGSAATLLIVGARLASSHAVFIGEVLAFLLAIGLGQGLALLLASLALGFTNLVERRVFGERRGADRLRPTRPN